jgi:hypothetical protein
MTKEEEQILDELGIEKSPMIGRCGTYRMPELNPEAITTLAKVKDTKEIYVVEYPDKVKNTSTGTGGVFDGSMYDGQVMTGEDWLQNNPPLETPTFFSVQRD